VFAVDTTLLNAIINSEALPSMPVVAFKVLELCRQEDIELDDVAEVIAKDPALTAKMLKVSNSSMFGMSKKVGTLDQAMKVLGLRTVKIMALGFSLVDSLKQDSGIGFDYPGYWRRSMSTAVAARQIAERSGDVRRDEAFVGGMLCDIGMMAVERHPDGIYRPVVELLRRDGGRIHEVEMSLLGITHAQLSALMLAKWSMPELLCHAVDGHHGYGFSESQGRTKVLSGILWAASEIAELFCGDIATEHFEQVREHMLSIVGITPQALDDVMNELNDQVAEAADMFSIELKDAISFEEIRTGAMMQLANISLAAQHDLQMAQHRAAEADSQVQSLSELAETLRRRAEVDKLTGIANRQAFDDRLTEAIDSAKSTRSDVGLILLDVDHFKKFNDTYGHLTGDEVLRNVGACLDEVTSDVQFAARYGGEEFAIIVADATAREVLNLAENIRKSIARMRIAHGQQDLSITASFGAAHVDFAEESPDATEFISRADACLYDAKREGRNRVEVTF
jgi:two-component system cell cycle response regulator